MLNVEQLNIRRGDKQLLMSLSFSLEEGEGLRLVGPNGAGKTSLMRVIAGLAKPDTGTIVASQNVHSAQYPTELKSTVLYLGHSSGLNARLTPEENLMWWLSLHGRQGNEHFDKRKISSLCRDALFAVGLFEQQLLPSGQLSAGQQRRAALARLFLEYKYIEHKKLWILDEPFTALDQDFTQQLVVRLSLHLERGGCLLLTTHHEINQLSLKQLNLAQFKPAKFSKHDVENI